MTPPLITRKLQRLDRVVWRSAEAETSRENLKNIEGKRWIALGHTRLTTFLI
jgi:hypothetical protein